MYWLRETLAFTEREHFSSAVSMLTKCLKIPVNTKTEFFKLIFLQSDKELWQKKIPWWFKPCFGAFTMLSDHKCSDTGLFMGFKYHRFFQPIISEKNNLWGSSFSPKYSKFYVDFGNAEKNSGKVFWFLGNCIWIGCVKDSLFLTDNTFRRVSIC